MENEKQVAVLLSKIDDLVVIVAELKSNIKEIDVSLRQHELTGVQQLTKLTHITEELTRKVQEIKEEAKESETRADYNEAAVKDLKKDMNYIKKISWWVIGVGGSAILGMVISTIKELIKRIP
jgi:DNA-binding transcriptional MerR regulator